MQLIGFRGCRKSELMPRSVSEIGKSSVGLMPTSMESTVPRSPDGSGRLSRYELAGGERGRFRSPTTPSSVNLATCRQSPAKGSSDECRDSTPGLLFPAKHRVDQHQHHSHSIDG